LGEHKPKASVSAVLRGATFQESNGAWCTAFIGLADEINCAEAGLSGGKIRLISRRFGRCGVGLQKPSKPFQLFAPTRSETALASSIGFPLLVFRFPWPARAQMKDQLNIQRVDVAPLEG
jgi:hypothetical protein